MTVEIHAVQTGSVQIKTAQRVRKSGGLIRVLTDSEWTRWLPIYVWVIDHPEGMIVVDTGETARTSEPGYFPWWHPYYRGSVRMNVQPEEEIGPQLRHIGINQKDVRTLILTHFHTDHAGGLSHFSASQILVSGADLKLASGFTGRLLGYLPNRWPDWFDPTPIAFEQEHFGPFDQVYKVTQAGDVVVVPTPGHTPDHVSVIVKSEDTYYFLAGDTSDYPNSDRSADRTPLAGGFVASRHLPKPTLQAHGEKATDAVDEARRTPLTSGPDADPERRSESHLCTLVSGDDLHGDSHRIPSPDSENYPVRTLSTNNLVLRNGTRAIPS